MRPFPARSVVPWPALVAVALLSAGVEAVVLRSQWDVMRSWASVVEAVDGSWLVLSILVVGCGAAVSVRPWQNRELTASLPDPGTRTVAAAGLAVGMVAAAVHLLAVLVLVAWGSSAGLPGQPRLWPVLSVLVGLCAAGLLGTAVTRLGAGILSPLLAMAVYVGLILLARVLALGQLLDFGGVSVVLIGLAPSTQAVLWRAAWTVAALAVLWWLASRGRAALRRTKFLLLVPVTAAVAVTTSVQADAGFQQTAVEWSCAPGPPRVCVAAEYADRLDDYAAALGAMAPAADSIGLRPPPDGYRQTFGTRPGPGSFNVDAEVNGMQLAFDLVQFGLPCSVDWRLDQVEQAEVVAGWLASRAGFAVPPDVGQVDGPRAEQALSDLRCQP